MPAVYPETAMGLKGLVPALALGALVLTSCATSLHGTGETLRIDSTPEGGAATLRCAELERAGKTPVAFVIPRHATDCIVTVEQSGFVTKTIAVERTVARAYWLNLIGVSMLPLGISDGTPVSISGEVGLALVAGGAAGLVIDAFNGAMFQHEPRDIHVALEPAAGVSTDR